MAKVNMKTEVIAGITTFFTMVYIVIVNPSILSSGGSGMPFSGVLTATVLLCFSMTLLMGIYAKLPFAIGPGMGINALFTFTIIARHHVPWTEALGIVFWSGVIFLACSLTPLRMMIADAIPENIRLAAGIGIGIFLTFIGLKNAGVVVSDPTTIVRLGSLNLTSIFVFVGLAVMVLLLRRKSPFAFLAGIAVVTVLGYLGGDVKAPEQIWSSPDFKSVFFKLDIWSSLKMAYVPSMMSIFLTDMFDSVSAFMGCSRALGIQDKDGNPKNLREGLIVDAWATLSAGLFGTSAGTTFIESAAGLEMGGRTGLTSIVTALCFIPCFFLAPLAGMVPPYATAPVLILVGGLMFRSVTGLRLDKVEEYIPAFLTVVLIPLTFSITQGIMWGFISHVALYLTAGRKKEIPPMLYALAVISISLLWIDNLS